MRPRSAADRAMPQAEEYTRLLGHLFGHVDGMVYRCCNDGFWTMQYVSDGATLLTGYPVEALLSSQVTYEDRGGFGISDTR